MKWKVKVGPEGIEKALDDELKKIVGVGHFEFRRARAQSAYMPMRMFHAFVDLVDRSGVVEKLHEWDALERKSNVGRKPVITFRAALVIELMTAFWNKGIQYQEVADTITHRLTRMQYGALGITPERVSEKRWYHRHWRAKSRILHLPTTLTVEGADRIAVTFEASPNDPCTANMAPTTHEFELPSEITVSPIVVEVSYEDWSETESLTLD